MKVHREALANVQNHMMVLAELARKNESNMDDIDNLARAYRDKYGADRFITKFEKEYRNGR